jgi:hypothetical protein
MRHAATAGFPLIGPTQFRQFGTTRFRDLGTTSGTFLAADPVHGSEGRGQLRLRAP